MARSLAVAASLALLVAAAVLAWTRSEPSYDQDEVRGAFGTQGYSLREANPFGATGDGPGTGRPEGTFLYPGEGKDARFYVFVARNDLVAREFFAPLERAGGGPGVLDLLEGNVVVSSDASLAPDGLTEDEQTRILAALAALDGDEA